MIRKFLTASLVLALSSVGVCYHGLNASIDESSSQPIPKKVVAINDFLDRSIDFDNAFGKSK